ncbi:MAG: VCBS repeat-containing protein [candidate division Zixibacteria bacterium]|nr:VCBS repeat-containing protein [candidate division Zixibacteria bacterium]
MCKYLSVVLQCFLLMLLLFLPANADIPMSYSSIWQGGNSAQVPTGVGWADFDGDGWLDLAVTRGLDESYVGNVVYCNSPEGLPDTVGWVSDDAQPSGQLYIGDFDNDGDPDLVVCNLGYRYTGFPSVPQVMYINDNGLSPIPAWQSTGTNVFSCGGGDVDGDGDLDLAFGQGIRSIINPDWSKAMPVALYVNHGGAFDTIPNWQSNELYYGTDVAFGDIDLDGDLDLVHSAGAGNAGVSVYYNLGGVLETSPSWHTNAIVGGRQMTFGDVDGDGYPDLAVAGSGSHFFLFHNNAGTLDSLPTWTSDAYDEPSAVAWADYDNDGDLDLAGGGWYSHFGIFENVGGTLTQKYIWRYLTGGAVTYSIQQIVWADYDNDYLVDTTVAITADGVKKVFYVGLQPLQAITQVALNGTPLDLTQYCYDLNEGWISLGLLPADGDELTIVCKYSHDLDLAATGTEIIVIENQTVTDPDDINILLVMDNHYGANFNYNDGNPNILQHFEDYRWDVTIAALTDSIYPCTYAASVGSPWFPVNRIFTSIPDITQYDCISIMPGDSHDSLRADQDALDLIALAADEELVVSAWCRATWVLATADVIEGREIVGKTDYLAEYVAAGAIFLGDDHPPVIDGNIVTSVRSRFYRTEMCEAIAQAIDLKYHPFYIFDSVQFVDQNGDGFYDSGETVAFYFFIKNNGMVDSNVTFTMSSINPDVVFTEPEVTFPAVEGRGARSNNLGIPLSYIIPELDHAILDTFMITIESDSGVYGEVFTFEHELGHTGILIVDDDRGDPYQYENVYRDDLRKKRMPAHVWEKATEGSPPGTEMNKYNTVIWFTADSADDYLVVDDIIAMKDFLDAGGNLFLTGQGLLSELHQEDSAFLEDYLHCRYGGDYFWYEHMGVDESRIGDGFKLRYQGGAEQAISLSQWAVPVGGAEPEFHFTNCNDCYSALTYNGDYRLALFTFGYEAIANGFTAWVGRDTILTRVLLFLEGWAGPVCIDSDGDGFGDPDYSDNNCDPDNCPYIYNPDQIDSDGDGIGDVCDYRCGDANSDEAINLLDILFLIDFVYGDPPGVAPDPIEAGDANADDNINLLDILYLIAFLYGSPPGPEPLCP